MRVHVVATGSSHRIWRLIRCEFLLLLEWQELTLILPLSFLGKFHGTSTLAIFDGWGRLSEHSVVE
jgi:hypothetical protein